MVTGDHDFLLKDNVEMREVLKAIDPETVYYEAKSSEDRMMRHVFPIFAPDWEESSEAIDLMVKNAEG